MRPEPQFPQPLAHAVSPPPPAYFTDRATPCGIVPQAFSTPEVPLTSSIGPRASAISEAYFAASESDNGCLTSTLNSWRDAGVELRIVSDSLGETCRQAISSRISSACACVVSNCLSTTARDFSAFSVLVSASLPWDSAVEESAIYGRLSELRITG
jgi:hypothetical protein